MATSRDRIEVHVLIDGQWCVVGGGDSERIARRGLTLAKKKYPYLQHRLYDTVREKELHL